MDLVTAPPRAFRTGVAVALSALWLAVPPTFAASLDDATALLKAGQHERALLQINELLESNPKDPEARFLKGVILAEQGDAGAAADVFQRLTQDYPALPEPYNNLAVIYAAQGRYDQARAALEKSIRTHPSYATAYDNLGDVYAKLAGEAYDRALRLDTTDPAGRKKLALVRELAAPAQAVPVRVASRAPGPPPAALSKAAVPADRGATPAKAVPPVTTAAAPTKPAEGVAPAVAPAKPAPAAPRADDKAPAVVASAKSQPAASAAPSGPDASALRSVKAWAKAWSAQDVDAYLAFYAPDFKTPQGVPRAEWETQRRSRISSPRSIKVTIHDAKVVRRDDRRVAVSFHQNYRSDRFQGRTRKTLELVWSGDDWRIVDEVVK